MADKVWVFDLDDTLMRTAELYTKQIENGYVLLCKQLRDNPPTLSKFKEKQLEIDSKLRNTINPVSNEPYRYSMKRFPLSLVKTYQYFCKQTKLDPLFEIEQEFEKIGMGVYLTIGKYRKKLKKDTRKLLFFLKEKGDILILLTKGDQRVQGKKLKALKREGVLRLFSKCMIVPDKTPEVFRKIKKQFSNKRQKRKFISVGNEFYSDIEAAMRAGFFGIWVPVSSAAVWDKGKLGKIEEDRDKTNSNRYKSLTEIQLKYKFLSNV